MKVRVADFGVLIAILTVFGWASVETFYKPAIGEKVFTPIPIKVSSPTPNNKPEDIVRGSIPSEVITETEKNLGVGEFTNYFSAIKQANNFAVSYGSIRALGEEINREPSKLDYFVKAITEVEKDPIMKSRAVLSLGFIPSASSHISKLLESSDSTVKTAAIYAAAINHSSPLHDNFKKTVAQLPNNYPIEQLFLVDSYIRPELKPLVAKELNSPNKDVRNAARDVYINQITKKENTADLDTFVRETVSSEFTDKMDRFLVNEAPLIQDENTRRDVFMKIYRESSSEITKLNAVMGMSKVEDKALDQELYAISLSQESYGHKTAIVDNVNTKLITKNEQKRESVLNIFRDRNNPLYLRMKAGELLISVRDTEMRKSFKNEIAEFTKEQISYIKSTESDKDKRDEAIAKIILMRMKANDK